MTCTVCESPFEWGRPVADKCAGCGSVYCRDCTPGFWACEHGTRLCLYCPAHARECSQCDEIVANTPEVYDATEPHP